MKILGKAIALKDMKTVTTVMDSLKLFIWPIMKVPPVVMVVSGPHR